MVRHIAALALFILATAAAPARADWTRMHEGSLGTSYIDLATVQKSGTLARVWQLHDLSEPGNVGENSRQSHNEYDCGKDRSRVLAYSAHSGAMAAGRSLFSRTFSEPNPSAWSPALPGSAAGAIGRSVCSGRR